ncbi:hypothetical protein [Microbacterium sp. CFBP9034]|uniref:hypothetical protein n=1 Tax=Microbacterium sp. CFBP9034 TaxID=3096540 RepID=UPI002A6B48D3|nr:hypothetical protein [Microbacterium sp. CFBP9034]MDY0911040.1 hypothetical protein [Microbacterium sp. CFBP9034]
MSDQTEPTPPQPPTSPPTVPAAAPWAPPGAPPFGAPAGTAGGQGAAAYAPPVGYALPPASPLAPAGPAGQARQPGPPLTAAAGSAPRTARLGLVALALAVVATVGTAVAVAIAAFNIGLGTGREIAMRAIDADFDWSVLTPVRGWVQLAETAFWIGTALGVWALVQGVIAIVKDRGRGAAIAAVAVAAIGPIVAFVVLQGFLAAGFTAGAGVGG